MTSRCRGVKLPTRHAAASRAENSVGSTPPSARWLYAILAAQDLNFRESLSQFSFALCQRAIVTRVKTEFRPHEWEDI